MIRLTIWLCLSASTIGCGAGPASSAGAARPGGQVTRPTTSLPSAEPRSATELVTMLQAIISGARPGRLEDHVDASFAERLPSGGTLDELFRGWPEDCVPTIREGPGYGGVAIPPPMDEDGPEDIARTEAIIAELQASTEVEASCHVVERFQDEADDPPTAHERTMMLFAIAVRADARGVFRVLAWRNFRGGDTSGR